MKRVLFLGAGRRIELIEKFTKRGFKVFSYETSFKVPARDVSKVILGLSWDDSELQKHLADSIKKNKIDLVIPCQDQASFVLSQMNIPQAVVSVINAAKICYDKIEFASFMEQNFPDNYPAFVYGKHSHYVKKPIHGFGGKGIYVGYSTSPVYPNDHEILQRFIDGTEYSVDSFFDNQGKYVDSVPRTRDRIGSGEVINSTVVVDENLQLLTQLIGEKIGGLRGPINFQYIRDNDTGKLYVIEINARFGGGYTLSMESGLDAISLIEKYWLNMETEYIPNSWRPIKLIRSFKDHYFEV